MKRILTGVTGYWTELGDGQAVNHIRRVAVQVLGIDWANVLVNISADQWIWRGILSLFAIVAKVA